MFRGLGFMGLKFTVWGLGFRCWSCFWIIARIPGGFSLLEVGFENAVTSEL